MKTRLLIIFAISVGILTLLFFPNEEQNICKQMGGIWNTDYCIVTQEMVDSNKVRCEPGPVFGDGYCYNNGIKFVFESESELNSEINRSCMTLEQSKEIAPFFKVPSYLPEGYSMKCSQSGMPYESYIIYHNKDVSDGWIGKMYMLIEDGAIFILQTDDRNLVGEEKFATIGSAEQRIQRTYDSVMENNPSLNPQLIRINGMLAYAVDSCPDCGVQTANFPDGTSIQKSTSTETKIKFIDEYGVSYMLETTLSLDELILVAESLSDY